MHPTFDDEAVDLRGAPGRLADFAAVLSSPTRVAVLRALMDAKEPLHINEVARRVGVDASPVRTHLELLEKVGLVDEVRPAAGRERRFRTRLANARLVLEGVNRPAPPPGAQASPVPKAVAKLEKRLADLREDADKIAAKARKVQAELRAAYNEASRS
ncbi:MAG TPA: winged helix-turn-helix domain-containing protein [Candidatus Thermoplasmatota archaeon]|nr:winged helix-turn-helix domain-containing protein [Candidatus Thermoplasmatota archaeon]